HVRQHPRGQVRVPRAFRGCRGGESHAPVEVACGPLPPAACGAVVQVGTHLGVVGAGLLAVEQRGERVAGTETFHARPVVRVAPMGPGDVASSCDGYRWPVPRPQRALRSAVTMPLEKPYG